ncbi:MAG: ABC transporter ATP-binding protein [Candidatus Omnitrophota bacterium]
MTTAQLGRGRASTAQMEKGEVLVSAKNVYKKFCKDLKRGMWYGLVDLSKNLVGIKPRTSGLRRDEFWALQDVSFELRRGEVLGVVGMNGSGKSTLLRLLAGILPPDAGEITVKGRTSSLISLGAGFHPLMSGRENIYLKGTLLKMTRRMIDAKLDSIIDFAELGDFINSPVGTYSSGMRIRLGFSIVIETQPDILLLDEVLAVGDRGFKAKCFKRIDELSKKCATVLVSQSADKMTRIATDLMVLRGGRKVFQSEDISAGIDFYHSQFADETGSATAKGGTVFKGADFVPRNGQSCREGVFTIAYRDDLEAEISFNLDPAVEKARMDVIFSDQDFNAVSNCRSNLCGFEIRNTLKTMRVRVRFPELQLSPRLYFMTAVLKDETGMVLARHHAINRFLVTGKFTTFSAFHLQADWDHVPDTAQH